MKHLSYCGREVFSRWRHNSLAFQNSLVTVGNRRYPFPMSDKHNLDNVTRQHKLGGVLAKALTRPVNYCRLASQHSDIIFLTELLANSPATEELHNVFLLLVVSLIGIFTQPCRGANMYNNKTTASWLKRLRSYHVATANQFHEAISTNKKKTDCS